nr:DNA internalization-related competence protein ComEC/Rec2 [Coralloluteibacterium stylophorae]
MPALPHVAVAFACAAAGALAWWRGRRTRWFGVLLFAAGWAWLHGDAALALRLPQELAGQDLRVEGRILGLPAPGDASTRFDLRILSAPPGAAQALVGRRVRLGWYGAAPTLEPGSRWALTVRLRRPRGSQNPGGFDFERHALERRLAATGYVRDADAARRLAAGGGVDALRDRLAVRIVAAVPGEASRFVRALALADTRGLEDGDWDVLRATGLTHLIAISGFHVGVVAGFGALLIGGLYRLLPGLGRRLPRPQGAAWGALAFAVAYAALAGFGLPTVRTVLMIAAALATVLLRRTAGPWQSLALAAIGVLLADPLAVLGAGFWLSFAGVAWLMWCLPRDGRRRWLREIAGAQGVATIALLPLTVWFFGQASIAGPLVNLVGIPVISLGVTPLAIAGTLLEPAWHAGGAALLRLAAWTMARLWQGVEPVAGWNGAFVWLPEPTPVAFAFALAGAFWLLLPRGVPGKWLAPLLWLPLLLPARSPPAAGEVDVALIDVGQGLSVLVRTRTHALLVDAGPAWPGGLDMGEAAVLPTLHALGVRRLDALVLSHTDGDHAGGLAAVRAGLPPARLLAPPDAAVAGAAACVAGQGWQWDGVHFGFLHPPPDFPYLGNESSCVLRVEGAGGAVLLPGDIGRQIEARLLRERPEGLPARILVVPHHGSGGSSSEAFVRAVAPELGLIGVGHGNRFGMPRPEVVARYRAVGTTLLTTAEEGFVEVRLGTDGSLREARRRRSHRRFWHETVR